MRNTIALLVILLATFSPVIAQTQIDAATKQDVEDMMQLTGVRERVPIILSAMASQFASNFAERYKQQHPNANPAEVQKATTAATEHLQQLLKAMPADEMIDAMIPVYQKYFTHSDFKAINEFYGTPAGQRLLKNSNAMTIEAMQAVQAVMSKHMSEIEAQAEKAAAAAGQSAPAQPQ
jgi:hypothetical protein